MNRHAPGMSPLYHLTINKTGTDADEIRLFFKIKVSVSCRKDISCAQLWIQQLHPLQIPQTGRTDYTLFLHPILQNQAHHLLWQKTVLSHILNLNIQINLSLAEVQHLFQLRNPLPGKIR